jgi:AcrR family transcriptional regulator
MSIVTASSMFPSDVRGRQARAERILDVAADLLRRHGYRRVTIDDVARGAGIGKGTVYLHWKTREALFSAVFEREVRTAIGGLLRALRKDSTAFLLHRLARAYFLAIMDRPLLRGFLLGDADLLGKLVRSDSAREHRHELMSARYFGLMADHDLVRGDLNPDALAYAFGAVLEGFLRTTAEAGETSRAQLEGRADVLAAIVQHAFETDSQVPQATQDVLAGRVIYFLDEVIGSDRAESAGPVETSRVARQP